MKPRIRPIANLYFRWGRALRLDAESIAHALESAGLIERIGANRYREIIAVKRPRAEYEMTVHDILTLHKAQTGGKNEQP